MPSPFPRFRQRRHRSHRKAAISAVTVLAMLIVTACGNTSDDAGTPSTDSARSQSTPADSTPIEPVATDTTPTPVPTTERAVDVPVEAVAPEETTTRGDAPFDGPAFTDLADGRMDELAVTFGLGVTSDNLSSIFELPNDFPYPDGTVIGVFHEFDRDQRYDDEIRIDEERLVGIDGAGDAAALDALQAILEADTEGRWQGASSQRGDFTNNLYTAPPLDGGDFKDRLVVRGFDEPDIGEPYLLVTLEQHPAEIPVPSWSAGLPTLDGGLLTAVAEGRGIVVAFGRIPEKGYIEQRTFYEIERFAELEEFMASGIIESAGFTYEDTPFSNFSIRIDVSNQDWEGTVGVGTIDIDGELFGYQLIWSLTRPGLVEAPPPAP